MARQPIVQGNPSDDDKQRDNALRPRWLREVIGQQAVVQRLGIHINACKKLKEPLEHILFDGPPGLGKTTFATVLPNELGTTIQMTSGPALTRPADMLPFLTNAAEGSILFIDEIHRMPRVVEEFIYPAMEDFRVDIVLGEGINARTISMPLKKFTLIGATTRSGMLSSPMRDRFKMHEHLDFYTIEELARIVTINAAKLQTPITPDAAVEIARRSRGTPRVANARLWWSRTYATSEVDGNITVEVARAALNMAEVDHQGLDKQDRRYLETLIGVFEGGPTGVEALAATMNLPSDTLSDEIEPYLLREQFIVRTPRGRQATPKAYKHLGKPPSLAEGFVQGQLFGGPQVVQEPGKQKEPEVANVLEKNDQTDVDVKPPKVEIEAQKNEEDGNKSEPGQVADRITPGLKLPNLLKKETEEEILRAEVVIGGKTKCSYCGSKLSSSAELRGARCIYCFGGTGGGRRIVKTTPEEVSPGQEQAIRELEDAPDGLDEL